MANEKFSDIEKVAIMMIGLGTEGAANLLKKFAASEVRQITSAMQKLDLVSKDDIADIMKEMNTLLKKFEQKKVVIARDFTKKVLQNAFRDEDADKWIHEVVESDGMRLAALELFEPQSLAQTIADERTQTIAIILSFLEAKKSAETLKYLPKDQLSPIILAMANMGDVSHEMLEEINEFLETKAEQMISRKSKKLGGVEKVASILGQLNRENEETILQAIGEKDPELSKKIRDNMLLFTDLLEIDARGIQELMKVTPQSLWKIALRNASPAVKDHIFANISSRAAQMLKEEMLSVPKMRLSEVESAQQQILQALTKLADEGKIILGREKTQYV